MQKTLLLAVAIIVGVFLLIAVVFGTDSFPMVVPVIVVALLVVVAYGRQVQRKEASARLQKLTQYARDTVDGLKAGRPILVEPRKAILHPGELAFLAMPATLMEQKTLGYASSGSSVRVRVMKGVSVGSYGGHSHAVKGIVRTAQGELVVTNKRVIFAGDLKSFEFPLTKLTNIEGYSDGLSLHHGSTTHLLAFQAPELTSAAAIVLKLTSSGQLTVDTVHRLPAA